jgi:hypothetical protein
VFIEVECTYVYSIRVSDHMYTSIYVCIVFIKKIRIEEKKKYTV